LRIQFSLYTLFEDVIADVVTIAEAPAKSGAFLIFLVTFDKSFEIHFGLI
jgi:hypothetical protein